jgi:hypothetical protein
LTLATSEAWRAAGTSYFEAAERRAFDLGRALVAEQGVRMDRLLVDADEVLWDWALDFSEMIRRARWRPRLFGWDLGHREWVQVRPGVMGLLHGMRCESLERGLDARLRIWTNGYPYRLWRILREIPGAFELLGLWEAGSELDLGLPGMDALLACAPTLVFRHDYTAAISALMEPARRQAWLAWVRPEVRRTLARHLLRHPTDPNLKLPALASLVGKSGLVGAGILVDDHIGNVVRFVRAGGHGVHLAARAPSLLGGRIPNTVWRRAASVLPALGADISEELAAALGRLGKGALPGEAGNGLIGPSEPTWLCVQPRTGRESPREPAISFVIEIPDDRVREQWTLPRERLRALLGGPSSAMALARSIAPEVVS